jgi:glycerol kinase
VANDWLMQFLADVCALPVLRPDYREMTALGAAAAAAMQLGWIDAVGWAARAVPGKRFEPSMAPETRTSLLEGWRVALARAL